MKGIRISLIGWYLILFAFIALSLMCLAGCKTVSQTDNHQETKTEISTDSANIEKIVADTTKTEHKTTEKEKTERSTETHTEKRDSTVTVVDKDGNVIGWKEYHWLVNSIRELSSTEKQLMDSLSAYKSKSDSLSYYRHIADSLSNIQKDVKQTVIEKKLSWLQQKKQDLSEVMLILLLLAGVYIGYKILRKKPQS